MSFLEEYENLRASLPVSAIRAHNNENCDHVDFTHNSRDCYYTFNIFNSVRIMYSTRCIGKDLVDCDFCVYCELCYDSVELMQCYNCRYVSHSDGCRDCSYCTLCKGCSDCFGCVSLTRKQYCIFNKQYTRSEYLKKVAEMNDKNPEEILAKVRKMVQQVPHPQSHQRENVNCPYGDYLNNSKNVYWGFSTYFLEDSGYFYEGGMSKNCWDCYYCGGGGGKEMLEGSCELCYEVSGGGGLYNCAFVTFGTNCTDCFYCTEIRNCTDCFGCVCLTNKKYCILNKQYTKVEYEQRVAKIKKELGWRE